MWRWGVSIATREKCRCNDLKHNCSGTVAFWGNPEEILIFVASVHSATSNIDTPGNLIPQGGLYCRSKGPAWRVPAHVTKAGRGAVGDILAMADAQGSVVSAGVLLMIVLLSILIFHLFGNLQHHTLQGSCYILDLVHIMRSRKRSPFILFELIPPCASADLKFY